MVVLKEPKELLIQKLEEMNIYDLERLRDCFNYEYKAEPENREYIQDILNHIVLVMDRKATE